MNTKQTEIGEIPEDWEVVKLGEIAEVKSGGTPSTSNKDFWDGEIAWCTPTDITALKGGKYLTQTSRNITKSGLQYSAAELLPVDSIVMTSRATIGECAIAKIPVTTNQGFKNFICFDKVDSEFIYYLLGTQKKRFVALCAGSTFLEININQVRNFQVALPKSNSKQTAIAAVLSDTDRLLAALRALIGKKRAVKTAAMQQLLSGRLRLPGFAATGRLKNSELGEIPEDWEVVKIKEFTDCTAGGTPSTVISEYWNGGIPWMNSGELHLKQVYDVSGRITELGLNNSSTSVVPKNSVLIGLAGQGKTRGTVAISRIPLCTNQSIAAVFPNNLFCSEYLFYNLENRYEELRSLSTGDGGRGGLNLTIIRNLAVPFPSHPEQTAIAQTLSDMDSEIAALEARAAKLAQIKQGLMQNLLTGKIRVNTGAA